MEIGEQLTIWDIMAAETEPQDVQIKGALNLHGKGEIKPFEVTLCTGDLVLIVSMIEDYIRGLDVIRADDIQWQVYYRRKYRDISDRIQRQIEYDYEKQRAKCLKKQDKEDNSDIGDEAISLMIKKANREAVRNEEIHDEGRNKG